MKKLAPALKKADNVKKLTTMLDANLNKKVGGSGVGTPILYNMDFQSNVFVERNPALNLAVMHRRHNCVAELLRRGADVNLVDRGGFSPLMDAAWNGEMNMVITLLKYGADPNAVGHSHFSGGIKTTERTAAEWARIRGHGERRVDLPGAALPCRRRCSCRTPAASRFRGHVTSPRPPPPSPPPPFLPRTSGGRGAHRELGRYARERAAGGAGEARGVAAIAR